MLLELLLAIICILTIIKHFTLKKENISRNQYIKKLHQELELNRENLEELNATAISLNNQISMYKNLIELSHHAIAIYSHDRELISYNDIFSKLWSLNKTWLNNKPLYDEILSHLIEENLIIDIDVIEYKKKQINRFSNTNINQEDYLYLTDGRIIKTIIIPGHEGTMLFAYEDMTDKLTSERLYNHLIKIYKNTIEHINEGISIFNQNGKLYLHNQQYCKIFDLDNQYLNTKPHLMDIFKQIEEKNSVKIDNETINLFTHYINTIDHRENTEIIVDFVRIKTYVQVIYLQESLVLFLYKKL